MKISMITVALLQENCYILHNDKDAVVFDPGGDFERIKKFLNDNKLTVKYILNTHAHFDHIASVEDLQNYSGAEFYISENDIELLKLGAEHALRFNVKDFKTITKYNTLKDGDEFSVGSAIIKVIATPGHSQGCVCFLITPLNVLISGDTIFHESVGRTDFPDSTPKDLVNSIKNKIYKLDDDVKIYPGHGTYTTVGHEKKYNPFVKL